MKAQGILLAAIVAGVSYAFADRFALPFAATVAWKCAGVALLALWCALNARSPDGWLIAAVMAFGAFGDGLIEWQLEAGAGTFLVGHAVAIVLYVRNRRPLLTPSQRGLAAVILPATILIAIMVVPHAQAPGVSIYALALGGMAAAAWASRFPRYRTGIGAMLFVASDLLIFARMGPLATSPAPGLLIWPLYFAGQVLIAYGVVSTLSTDDRGRMP